MRSAATTAPGGAWIARADSRLCAFTIDVFVVTQAHQSPSASGEAAVLEKIQSEVRALNAAVKVVVQQIPSRSPGPGLATDAVVKQITQALPGILAPAIQTMQNELQQSLGTQHSQALMDLAKTLVSSRTTGGVQDTAAREMAPNGHSSNAIPFSGVA